MAERHLAASLAGCGNLEATLKLLGDVRLCYYSSAPPRPGQASDQSSHVTTAQEYLAAALERSVLGLWDGNALSPETVSHKRLELRPIDAAYWV